MKRYGMGLVAALACLLFAANAGAQANLGGTPGSCDKACLRSLADGYFAALVAHDPTKAAMAPGAKFTFESIHIFKIQKAQNHDIEAMGISLPLHSKNGWSDFWR